MRKQAFFHASHENQLKLQALGRMQGHQLHSIIGFLGLGIAGVECGLIQESREEGF